MHIVINMNSINVSKSLQDSDVLVYVVFAFGILSVFKYVPSMPADCDKAEDCPDVTVRGILTGDYCDVTWASIRLKSSLTQFCVQQDVQSNNK